MLRSFNSDKMYTYLKGYAMGKSMPNTLNALNYARKLHKGQTRKSGEEYIIHPLTLACHAISIGIDDDFIVASLILHDVVEDCGVSKNDLPVCDEVREAVQLLSFFKPKDANEDEVESAKKEYYEALSKNSISAICKIFDRCHNVSTMAGVFSKEKLKSYIIETENYVLPLIRTTKDYYPQYQAPLFVLKYHIVSVLDAIEGTIKTFSCEKGGN